MLRLALELVLLGAACGRRTGAPEELWSEAPPGGRRVVANAWDTLWSVGGNVVDTTLQRPFLLAANVGGVFVYDGSAKRVTAYGRDGAVRWRFGRAGRGPDEFAKVRDMRATADGGVDLLDPQNNRILRLRGDGTVRTRIPLNGVGHAEQMAQVDGNTFVLMTLRPDSAFMVIDSAGVPRSRFTLPWDGFSRLEPLARQGTIATGGGRWVFAFAFGDGWFPYHGLRPDPYLGRFVEHTPFPKVSPEATPLGTAKKMDDFNACAACSVSLSGSTLYVHFGGYSRMAQQVVDLYDLNAGAYRGSWVLPSVAKVVEVFGDQVYALTENPYPELIALRPRARSAASIATR